MKQLEAEAGRYVALSRNKIRQRGYTQRQIQETLGWGRASISRLVKKPKALRLKQVLLILEAIGMEPTKFFGELYGRTEAPSGSLEISPPRCHPGQVDYRQLDKPHTISRYRLEVVCEERVPLGLLHSCDGPEQTAAVLEVLIP